MREAIEGYILAVERNIEEYMQIEDESDRQRALSASYKMLEKFRQMLSDLDK